jgi:osmotically-inducible protein OsmY
MSCAFVSSDAAYNAPASCPPTPALAIPQIAEHRLRNSSYWAVRTVSCDYHEGVLILRGRVSAYYLKQVAQTVVREMDGVQEINNFIEVVRPSSMHPISDRSDEFCDR